MLLTKLGVRTVFLLSIIFIIGGLIPAERATSSSGYNQYGWKYQDFEVTLDEFVILSNDTDAAFCRDFSTSLKWSAIDWVILEKPAFPEGIKDKHVLLIGGPHSKYSWDLIEELTTQEERDLILGQGGYAVFNKESP